MLSNCSKAESLYYKFIGDNNNGVNNQEALINYKKALDLDPNNTSTLYNIANISFYNNDFDSTTLYLNRLQNIDPNNFLYLMLKSEVLTHNKEYELSNQHLEKAIALQESSYLIFLFGNNLQFLNKHNEAILVFNKSIALDSTYDLAYHGICYSYGNLKQYTLGIPFCSKAIELNDTNQLYYITRSYQNNFLENFSESLSDAHMALDLSKSNARPYTLLATIYYTMKNYDEAKNILLSVVDTFPNNSVISYNLSCYYSLLGQKQNALIYLKKTLALGVYGPEIIRADTDFDNIKLMDEFKELVSLQIQ